MAWPGKGTHKIVVRGEEYLWHLNGDWVVKNTWITIKKRGYEGQLLLLDPYSTWSFGPGPVAEAIDFALMNGWTPTLKSTLFKVRYIGDSPHRSRTFIRLPNDVGPNQPQSIIRESNTV